MTIAEKLTRVAENVPLVYKEGQRSMVDESKIIEKTVSGSVIALDDVSEVQHEVSVQLSSDTVTDFSGVAVKVLGKNLFDKDNGIIIDGYIGGTINTVANAYKTVAIPCAPNTTYTISRIAGTRFEAGTTLEYPKNGTVVYDNVRDYTGKSTTITTGAYAKYLVAYIWNNSTDTSISAAEMINSVQIELGHNATTYESYSETIYTAEADGSVKVKSLSPYMTILPDINDEVIYVTYHKSWGMQTEYDRFWDAYIGKDGDVITAVSMFSGYRWIDDIYNPKHTIKASAFSSMYQNCSITDTKVTLDVSNGSGTNLFFNATNLKNIVKLIVSSKNTFGSWFYNCRALEELRFEGVIGNSLDIHWSTKLSADSYLNILEHLSPDVTGMTVTLPTVAEATFEAKYGEGTWELFVTTSYGAKNWTFAYA